MSREQLIRQAVLLGICDSRLHSFDWVSSLSPRQWTRLLRWLDLSGLALYFFDRVAGAQQTEPIPAPIYASLRRRLMENTQRTHSLIGESIAIQHEFQKAGLRYAILKGLAFWPSSFSAPNLRLQFDLDYLVAEECMPEARIILVRRGYRLYATNGRSWEFKRNERPGIALKDLYKDTGSWAVELHVESTDAAHTAPLRCVAWRELWGLAMPVLSPVDLLLGQGLHAYKHVCAEFCRAALLVEFRRHVLFRYGNDVFWAELQRQASGNSQAALRLGVVAHLIAQVMGEFAPESFTGWTVGRLPRSARLWVEIYGGRALLGSHPGSKFYLLLEREFESEGIQAKRSRRQSLLPSRLPPPIILPFPNEALPVRLSRYRMQLALIFCRLRFHLVEGLQFAWESHRWRRLLGKAAR